MAGTTFESYKGIRIAIKTARHGDSDWAAEAEFMSQVKPGAGASEEEARKSALQAAVESIDRSRVSTGKW